MRQNGLGKLYDRLTPEERFRLDVLAMARGDAEEPELLTRSCPKRNYTMNEWAFSARWHAARELAMLTYMDLAKCLDKLQMIEAFRVSFPYFRNVWAEDVCEAYFEGHEAGSRHAWAKAGKEGEPPGYEADEDERVEGVDPAIEEEVRRWCSKVKEIEAPIAKALDKLEREMVEEGFSVWSAFAGFCAEEMGVAALNLLAAFGPFRERAQKLIELAERLEVEPDAEEEIEEYRGILLAAWQREVQKG
jgi:hypothetical protein